MPELLIQPNPVGEVPKIGHEQTDDTGEQTGGKRPNRKQQRKTPDIPSEEECSGAIAQVARLAAMGLLKPAQANAIRGSFREILMYHQRKAKESEQGISNVDVLDVFQQDPKLLSLLEPRDPVLPRGSRSTAGWGFDEVDGTQVRIDRNPVFPREEADEPVPTR